MVGTQIPAPVSKPGQKTQICRASRTGQRERGYDGKGGRGEMGEWGGRTDAAFHVIRKLVFICIRKTYRWNQTTHHVLTSWLKCIFP